MYRQNYVSFGKPNYRVTSVPENYSGNAFSKGGIVTREDITGKNNGKDEDKYTDTDMSTEKESNADEYGYVKEHDTYLHKNADGINDGNTPAELSSAEKSRGFLKGENEKRTAARMPMMSGLGIDPDTALLFLVLLVLLAGGGEREDGALFMILILLML